MTAIKFGVCGLGRIGRRHAQFFSRNRAHYELVALCDMDGPRSEAMAKEFGATGYADYAAFLANPEMELVIISTRSLDHVSNAADALAAGKTVLLDKPIAVTSEDFRRLQELDRTYRGKLFFLHNIRFQPAFQSIQRIIAEGLIGEVQFVKIRRHHGFSRRNDWQTLLRYGGGQLSCWGPHVIDQGLQFIHSPLQKIWGHLQLVNARGDADDQVKIMLVGENGIVADLEISYMAALRDPYYTVYGNRGTLICPDEKIIRLRYMDPSFSFDDRPAHEGDPLALAGAGFGGDEKVPWIEKEVKVEPEGDPADAWETAIALNLYRALREGVPFPVTSEHAFEVVRVTEEVKRQNPQFNWVG